jgi:S1-C subfamily serine protease
MPLSITPELKTNLRKALANLFDLSELQLLCFDLGIDYDELTGENKSTKIISLLGYLERRGRLSVLVAYGQRERPQFNWPALTSQTGPPRTDSHDEREAENRAWQTEFGIRALRSAVVWIMAGRSGYIQVQQCGFLVDPRGYILTMDSSGNNDLTFTVQWNKLEFPALPVDRNQDAQVALLKIDLATHPLYNSFFIHEGAESNIHPFFPSVSLDTGDLQVGEEVYLLGYNPESGWINTEGTIRQLEVAQEHSKVPLVVVEVMTRLGFSGAPYMNRHGRVVGFHLGRRLGSDSLKTMIPARYGLELIAANL